MIAVGLQHCVLPPSFSVRLLFVFPPGAVIKIYTVQSS